MCVFYLWSLPSGWWMGWPGQMVSALPHPDHSFPSVCPLPGRQRAEVRHCLCGGWDDGCGYSNSIRHRCSQQCRTEGYKLPHTNKQNGMRQSWDEMIDNGDDNGDQGQDDDINTHCEREWDEDKNTGSIRERKEVSHFQNVEQLTRPHWWVSKWLVWSPKRVDIQTGCTINGKYLISKLLKIFSMLLNWNCTWF